MTVLLYAPVSESIREKFQNEIEKLVPTEKMETYRTKEELSTGLRGPRKDTTVAVLIAMNKKKFLEILSLRELLEDLRIILLLPDRKEDTIEKGHLLRPRFLGYADSDLMVLAPVLEKMLKNSYRDNSFKEDDKEPSTFKSRNTTKKVLGGSVEN